MLTTAACRTLLAAADAEAQRNNWRVTIAIVDAAGDLLCQQRHDEAAGNTADFAHGKARTAARYRRPTRSMDSTIANGRPHLLAITGILPIEGGLPIQLDGAVIGGIGVSGATAAQDAQVARAGLTALVR
ncbi:MAG: heme-binding protein [Gemmatimonadaceae bacterium]|nr:heme-binding protein [Gemmatimonadaceae bacterium]